MIIPGTQQFISDFTLKTFTLMVNVAFFVFLCTVPGMEDHNRFGAGPITQLNKIGVPQYVFLGVPVFLLFMTLLILGFILKNPVLREYVF